MLVKTSNEKAFDWNSEKAKIRAAGLVCGALTGLGVGGALTFLAPTPALSRYAPYVVGPTAGILAGAKLMRLAREAELNKKASEESEKDLMFLGGVGGGGIGAGLVRDAWRGGELTGRRTLYHGTARKNAPSILERGLEATNDENAVNTATLKRAGGEVYDKSKGKTYLTRSRPQATCYAAMSDSGGVDEFRKLSPLKKAKAVLKALVGDGVVEFNIPIDAYERVANPETAGGYENYERNFLKAHGGSKVGAPFDYNSLHHDAVVLDADRVSPEFAVKSRKYKGNSLREVREFIRKHPKTFAKGVGKVGLGAGALAGSGYMIGKSLED